MRILKKSALNLFVALSLFALNVGATDYQFKNLKSVPVDAQICSHLLSPPLPNLVNLGDEKEVILTVWNPENVMDLKGAYRYAGVNGPKQTYDYSRKPEKDRQMGDWKFAAKQDKILKVGQYLGLNGNPLSHFIVSPEVENLNAANQLFNTGPLANRYNTYLIEGNDERGIDIALAVRSDLNVTVESETHKNVVWHDYVENTDVRLFSRDLPAWIIKNHATGKVELIIFGNHAKSKRDRAGGRDRESTQLRTAQYVGAAQIIEGYQERFGADVPIFMMGDFNTDVRFGPEVKPIKAILKDAFDLVGTKDRITQTYHPNGGATVESQLDAVLVSPSAETYVLRAEVLPEFDRHTGRRLGNPKTYDDRSKNYPSDHRAASAVLDGKLFKKK